jgi:DNA invertase Pin-like site-specific DNA recombinase
VSSTKQAKRDGRDEGLSIPAQREIVLRFIQEKGWNFVDEYVEPGKTARNTERPALREMVQRIAERRDVDVVVMHKFDRFARNAGDHLTMKAAFKRLGVRLVSVVEPVEDNASGKMIEGVLAVLNEHYSDNLSTEVKKGQAL